jgi:hypothetical protein
MCASLNAFFRGFVTRRNLTPNGGNRVTEDQAEERAEPAIVPVEVARTKAICRNMVWNAMRSAMKVKCGKVVWSGIVPVLEMATDEALIIAAAPEAAQTEV